MDHRKVIGIDFGSSQSSIAIMSIGSTEPPELLNVGGGRNGVTIPTILALDPNDDSVIAYGNDVKKHYREDSGNVKFASNFKRYLGTATKESKDANLYCKLFLRELAKFVKDRFALKVLDPEDYVTCIAHPATWTNEQIELLKKFTEEAGFPSDPDFGIYTIEEPVAAMHALKVQDTMKFKFGAKPEHYMVIDFGGGTLDICVIKTDILGRTPKIVATSGDPQLGGKEFDEIFETLFFRRCNVDKNDLSPRELAELSDKFKEAKEAFSENFRINDVATQPFHISRGQYSLEVTKLEFQNICRDQSIFEKIKRSIRDALEKAQIDAPKISKVILTGGSAKWYFLREIVAKEFAIGGDSIFLTENPFTDVANGCAISIGRPDAPPEKEGVWVKYKLGDDGKWSDPKCILNPGRKASTEESLQYIGTIIGTRYFKPYRITISWWIGNDKNNLTPSGNDAVIEFYARGNYPCLDRLKRLRQALCDIDTKKMPDEYKIYLQYQEDKAGSIKYHFEIMDSTAASKEAKRSREGDAAVQNMPDGHREVGDVLPGFISFRAFEGMRSRKLMPLKKGAK